jgi:transcriptional regulator with XRE-family HTH domain
MLADRIREIRTLKGWKQSKVADYMNISQQAYSNFEKSNSPRIDTLIRLCEVMNIEISFLFAYKVPVTKESIEKYGTKGFANLIQEHKKLKQQLEFLNNRNKTKTTHIQVERPLYLPIAAGQ